MTLLKRLLSMFATTLPVAPVTLISFRCDGCMAQDWREDDRGTLVGHIRRSIYGSGPAGVLYDVVERADGTRFECYAPYTMWGTAEMQQHTGNPDESLVGKLVHTH